MIKLENFPKYLFSWAVRRISVGTQKRVRIIHGKRAIGVRVIEVLLYIISLWSFVDVAEDKRADRTPICNFELHLNLGQGRLSKTGLTL